MLTTLLTPGVYTRETDLSLFPSNVSSTAVGMIGTADKGPVNIPTLITSPEQFLRVFGNPNVNSLGTYSALEYLRNGSNLWYNRVGNSSINGSEAALALSSVTLSGASSNGGIKVYALTPGVWGNKLSVKVDTSGSSFTLRVYVNGVLKETFKPCTVIEGDADNVEDKVGAFLSGFQTRAGLSSLIAVDIVGYGTNNASRSVPVTTANPQALTGGKSGLKPTLAEIIGATTNGVRTGIHTFDNLEESDISVLCVPGETDTTVITAMIDLCVSRGDCLAVIDPPAATSVADVLLFQSPDDSSRAFLRSSYAAIYWPWVKVQDSFTNKLLTLPPSAFAVSQMAYNDRVGFPWNAPAGFQRGRLESAVALEYNCSQSERDALYGELNAVNPIIFTRNLGIAIFGQKTLGQNSQVLDRVNVRRMVLYLRKEIRRISQGLLFEPNDTRTWDAFKLQVTPVLESVKNNRGLVNYRVKMDQDTITPLDIANNQMPGQIFLQPLETAEVITLDFTLVPSGAIFENV